MNAQEAIAKLEQMQGQIIHGSRIFADIADVIRQLDAVRLAALKAVKEEIGEQHAEDVSEELLLAHRILANNNAQGQFTGETRNTTVA